MNNIEADNRNKQITFEVYEKMKTTKYIISKEEQEAVKSYFCPLKREIETGNIDTEKLIMLIKMTDVFLDYGFNEDNSFDMVLFLGDKIIISVLPGHEYYDSSWDIVSDSSDEEDRRIFEALYNEYDGFYFRLRNWPDDETFVVTAEEERAFNRLLLPLAEEIQSGNLYITRVVELLELMWFILGRNQPDIVSFFHRLSKSILNKEQKL